MRVIWLACLAAALTACNETSEKTKSEEKTDSETGPGSATSINPVSLSLADLPKTFVFKGHVQDAWQWTDKAGENIFFTTVVPPYPDNEKGQYGEEGETAELYAFHYSKKNGEYQLNWELKDGEKACPLDITTEFIKGASTVTDLDKDGFAETKVQYALSCRGDVSESKMKLIMQENKAVYSLDGYRWLSYGPNDKFEVNASNVNIETLPKSDSEDNILPGRYASEKSFEGAPPAFLEYARNEWLKYVIQKL